MSPTLRSRAWSSRGRCAHRRESSPVPSAVRVSRRRRTRRRRSSERALSLSSRRASSGRRRSRNRRPAPLRPLLLAMRELPPHARRIEQRADAPGSRPGLRLNRAAGIDIGTCSD
uniref:Uncharacterized protein n=1 Tax=Arundo donax TaxID=35708 RepID=A0A0A9A0M6_ARUDO